MAYCQSDIAWPQIEKISATVKDVNKKLSKVIPRRPTLQLHRTYYTVISGCHLRSLITAKVEHVVSLGCQRTDCTLGCIVVYRITTILYIGKDVCPKCIQIVQRFLQIRSNSRRILGLLYTEMSAEIYQDAFRLKTLTLFSSLLVSKIILCILAFQVLQILYILNEDIGILVTSLLACLHKLGTRMCKTHLMVCLG